MNRRADRKPIPVALDSWRREALLGLASLALCATNGCLERRQNDSTPEVHRCTACHGSSNNPGDEWLKSAPPSDTMGNSSPEYPGVGAHQLHLHPSSSHPAFACKECHVVPEVTEQPGHIDSARPAELIFGALATAGERSPVYDPAARSCSETYCHRRQSDAVWTRPRSTAEACGSCHGLPPPSPHPQTEECWACHENLRADRTFIDPEQHVNGQVEVREGVCTACHGSSNNPGAGLVQAAPPVDTEGHSSERYRGVGAHAQHLYDTDTHAAVVCGECHLVPASARDEGHADTSLPAEIVFGDLAAHGGREPTYSVNRVACANTYCHGDSVPRWTSPRSSSDACGSCHGLPPPPPHPVSERCGACHQNSAANSQFLDPGLHVNGIVEVGAPRCTACHGSSDSPAPPVDTQGNVAVSAPGVGAHDAHLRGGESSRSLECSECHQVPAGPSSAAHVEGGRAEVELSGVAEARGRTPSYDSASLSCRNTWCHGPSSSTSKASSSVSPVWTQEGSLACDACHGLPPAEPHPQVANCFICHGSVIARDNRTIADRSRHVDGVIDLIDLTRVRCTTCHGSINPAPPADLSGNLEPSAPSVGAHQSHLVPKGPARAVACAECHRVPQALDSEGHIDTLLPAEVTFSGVATAFQAKPEYREGSCKNTYCHGESYVGGNPSGGTSVRPTWTRVDGSQRACGSCHALPPPAPHPPNADRCADCHHDIDGEREFSRPDLHIDGDVTFDVIQ